MLRRPLLFCAMAIAGSGYAQSGREDLGSLGLEDLMKLQVTTASRSDQSFLKVPAAIYVVTGDDIRRSSAQTVPEMLRMVPGIQVYVVDGNKWSVSIRGFGSRYANKLQVLIDGRSIYTPLFSGVYWDTNLVSPDEIDRIEVIRGPGGALWGANAVNGIINIITLPAKDTQGGLSTVGFGDANVANHSLRYGGTSGKEGYYRVYARYLGFSDLDLAAGGKNNDGWNALHGAFRLDQQLTMKDSVSVSARLVRANIRQYSQVQSLSVPHLSVVPDSYPANDWSLQASWNRTDSPARNSQVHLSVSGNDRTSLDASTRTSVVDLGYQASQQGPDGSTLILGAGARRYADKVAQGPPISFARDRVVNHVLSGYAHYERDVWPNTRLSLGTTIEHNSYTGLEIQPSASLIHTRERESYWISASRAVRTPSRTDDSLDLTYSTNAGNPLPTRVIISGNPNFNSETLVAFEVGARFRPREDLFFDVTGFLHSYDNLRTYEAGTPFMVNSPIPHIVAPYTIGNKLQGTTAGLELAATYQPNNRWKLDLTASYFSDRFRLDADSTDPFGSTSSERQGHTPRTQLALHSAHTLADGLMADIMFTHGASRPNVPLRGLSAFDVGITWKPNLQTTISTFGRNLFGQRAAQADPYLFESLSTSGSSYGIQVSFKF